MNKTKFRPVSVPYVIAVSLITLLLIGMGYLFVKGILILDVFYVFVGGVGLIMFLPIVIKILLWKITITQDSIYIRSNIFDKYFTAKNKDSGIHLAGKKERRIYFAEKKERRISFIDIESVGLVTFPAQVLSINMIDGGVEIIYIKHFSKKQVNNIINKINSNLLVCKK